MDFEVVFKAVIGLDVHPARITACAIWADADDNPQHRFQNFGSTQKEIRHLADWAARLKSELVVMESTGVYWKSVYRELAERDLKISVVNARHIKNVPGRKTDMVDSLWLAMLGRAGLLRGSFVAPPEFDALRLISRRRQKLVGILIGEKNRFHKVLADAGVRLSCVVSDLQGQAARRMSVCLIEDGSPEEALALAGGRLKADKKDLLEAPDGKLTEAHRFVLAEILAHIVELEKRIARFEAELLRGLAPYQWALDILQTIPGVDLIGAAMIVVEIGVDMEAFGDAEHLASWAGVCPGNNESAGKRKSGHTRKGNRWLRGLLCEAANAARQTRCLFQVKFQSLALRRGRKRAIMAVAHKLLKTIFVLLKRKEGYRDASVNYGGY